MKIGIYTRDDRTRGLWRDVETLQWALRQSVWTFDALETSRFEVERLGDLDGRVPHCGFPGSRPFRSWVEELDVVIFLEVLLPNVLVHVPPRVRTAVIPNLEWAAYGAEGFRGFIDEAARHDVEVWTKTQHTYEAFMNADAEGRGLRVERLPWSIPDSVVHERTARTEGPLRLLFNAGYGGFKGRRNTEAVGALWKRLQADGATDVELTVKCLDKKLRRHFTNALGGLIRGRTAESDPALRFDARFVERKRMRQHYAWADAMLYPSRVEGFGIPALEALHTGLPVLATDVAPMNEIVEDGVTGIHLPTTSKGQRNAAPTGEVDVDTLVEVVHALRRNRQPLVDLTARIPGELQARQHAFRLALHSLVRDVEAPRLLAFRSERKAAETRSEVFVAHALRRHGFQVSEAFESRAAEGKLPPEETVGGVFVAKMPLPALRRVRAAYPAAPLVVWHFDPVHLTSGKRWFQEAIPIADHAFCSDDGIWDGADYVLPGARSFAPHPRRHERRHGFPADTLEGRRGLSPAPILGGDAPTSPYLEPGVDTEVPEVLFQATYLTPSRKRWLRAIAKVVAPMEGWRVRVQGVRADTELADNGVVFAPGAFGGEGRWAAARAAVALAINIDDETQYRYTSNRLFCLAEAGACILAHEMKGARHLFGDDAVCWTTPERVAEDVVALLEDPVRREAMRRAALRRYWAKHTWDHRVHALLSIAADPEVVLDNAPRHGWESPPRLRHTHHDLIVEAQAKSGDYYEAELLGHLTDLRTELYPKRTIFVDVGAHVGNHSLAMQRLGLRALAFEGDDNRADQASENLLADESAQEEGQRPRVYGGIVGHGGFVRLLRQASWQNTGDSAWTPVVEINASTERARRLDDCIPTADYAKVFAVKIDVQGMERAVLEGAQALLEEGRPIVVVEAKDLMPLRGLIPQGYGVSAVVNATKTYVLVPEGGDPLPWEGGADA
jgi:FkbM family methyltransferase